jgi:hypothetical protein
MSDPPRDSDTMRAFVVRHALALYAYHGRPASELTSHQLHEWARHAGLTIDAPADAAQRTDAERGHPIRLLIDCEALEARIPHEVLARVFDRDRDGQLELLPALLDEASTYVLGRVHRVERGHRPLVSSVPLVAYGERSPDQQATLRRLAIDVAHALLAIRYPLHVSSVDGFRLLDRVDAEITFWF